MFLKKSILEILVNILTGVSWAIALMGAYFAFQKYLHIGFIEAIVASIIGSLIGLFLVAIMEGVNLLLKQNRALDELNRKLKESEELSDN